MTVKELMDILAQQDADAEIDLSKDNILQTVSIVDNGKFFEEKRNDLYCFNKTKNNNMIVYLVRQTQTNGEYCEKTIYVCSTKERAVEYARKLNKQYGFGVKFDENYDFVDDDGNDILHYYDVEETEVDQELAPFYT